MTRPKNVAPKPNGRPRVEAYDSVSKNCEECGRAFFLREQRFQSFNKFQKRRFCSTSCVNQNKASAQCDGKAYILDRIVVTEAGCWEWARAKTRKGYGHAQKGAIKLRAHRFAFELWNGPIPDGMMVLHSCDNPPCCNPEHLRVGTAKDNVFDMIQRNRAWFLKRSAA